MKLVLYNLLAVAFLSSLELFESPVLSAQDITAHNVLVVAIDYCNFLNHVAAADPNHLYDDKMGSDSIGGCIVRLGTPGHYHYQAIVGREGQPIKDLSWLDKAYYCNWLENYQPSGEETRATIEDGSYALDRDSSKIMAAIPLNEGAFYSIPNELENNEGDIALKSNEIGFSIVYPNTELTLSLPDGNVTRWSPREKGIAGLLAAIGGLAIASYLYDACTKKPYDQKDFIDQDTKARDLYLTRDKRVSRVSVIVTDDNFGESIISNIDDTIFFEEALSDAFDYKYDPSSHYYNKNFLQSAPRRRSESLSEFNHRIDQEVPHYHVGISEQEKIREEQLDTLRKLRDKLFPLNQKGARKHNQRIESKLNKCDSFKKSSFNEVLKDCYHKADHFFKMEIDHSNPQYDFDLAFRMKELLDEIEKLEEDDSIALEDNKEYVDWTMQMLRLKLYKFSLKDTLINEEKTEKIRDQERRSNPKVKKGSPQITLADLQVLYKKISDDIELKETLFAEMQQKRENIYARLAFLNPDPLKSHQDIVALLKKIDEQLWHILYKKVTAKEKKAAIHRLETTLESKVKAFECSQRISDISNSHLDAEERRKLISTYELWEKALTNNPTRGLTWSNYWRYLIGR